MKSLISTIVLSASIYTFAADKTKSMNQEHHEAMDKNVAEFNVENIGHEAFMKAPGLTDAQRIKLGEIMKQTFKEAREIKMEIAKNKIDLFDAITSPTAKESEVNTLKQKITQLDQKRLTLMFKSLDETQKVIGKNPETGKYLRNIMREKMHMDRL